MCSARHCSPDAAVMIDRQFGEIARHCPNCGAILIRRPQPCGRMETPAQFAVRKYCDRTCMAAEWRGEFRGGTGWMATHHRARQLVPGGVCSRCGAANASDVHHEDHDHQNNGLENLSRICRSCHIKEHRPRATCSICGQPTVGRGFCAKHYQRLRKYGSLHIASRQEFLAGTTA